MIRLWVLIPVVLPLIGCGGIGLRLKSEPIVIEARRASEDTVRPRARPSLAAQSAVLDTGGANTPESLDITTDQARAEALAPPQGAETSLGVTVASLGSPAEPGFWLKTPLVERAAQGRVVYPETGQSVLVNLIPLEGPDTAGSRMSLSAMRLIGAPLTGLPELQVYLVK